MKLERARELYSDYAEGTLSPAMRLALEQHLAADAEARADYAQFQSVYHLMNAHDAPQVEVPLGFRAKVLELAAEAQARRDATPARRAALSLTGWFASLGHRRRLTGGLAAALAVAGLAGVLVHSVGTGQATTSGLGPGPTIPLLPSRVPTVIRGVSSQAGPDNNTYHLFHVHLPPGVPQATLAAFVVTSTDQITDPDIRAREATPALKQPMTLTNREEMQIPVALLKEAPAGTTLNLLVQWTPVNPALPSGAQVVFTPVATSAVPAPAGPDGSNFYDALQDIAADYGVTVVADASAAPTTPVSDAPAGDTAQQALQAVAGQVGYSVQALDKTTYQVYPNRQ